MAPLSTETRPLVSYIVVSFNQERFIREGVESALAQTYSPLQIIISDDASTDNTYAIIQSIHNSYSGRHQVSIRRNPANLGIGPHINELVKLCKGSLVVISAGDDISLPH